MIARAFFRLFLTLFSISAAPIKRLDLITGTFQ
jgi:hypothetical protein